MTDEMLIVNFAALEQASVDIQAALGEMESQLTQLERDAAPLVAAWGGDARQAYDVRQAKWRAAADDLTAMLRDIKVALDESVADYRSTEQRNVHLFS
jgi:early secretory antigenic target protein ESAT-6